MFRPRQFSILHGGVAFAIAFGLCVCLGILLSLARPAAAASRTSSVHPKDYLIQATAQVTTTGEYRGPELCGGCHKTFTLSGPPRFTRRLSLRRSSRRRGPKTPTRTRACNATRPATIQPMALTNSKV